eukprot:Ihof_evm12s180 gene=Ihof_evmTU12s180
MFIDLNIPLSDDKAQLSRTFSMLLKLGYDGAAFSRTITGKVTMDHANKNKGAEFVTLPSTEKDCRGAAKKFKQYSRLNVVLSDQGQIYSLNSNNAALKTYDILSVTPETEKLFQYACATAEIDIISFDMATRMPYFLKRTHVGQAIERGIHFEICYSAALKDSTARRYLISNTHHIIRATKGQNIIISSDAAAALDLRGPYDIINLAMLFTLPQAEGRKALSSNPRSVIMHA